MIKKFKIFESKIDILNLKDIFEEIEDEFNIKIKWLYSTNQTIFEFESDFDLVKEDPSEVSVSIDKLQENEIYNLLLNKFLISEKDIEEISYLNNRSMEENISNRIAYIRKHKINKNKFFDMILSIANYEISDIQIGSEFETSDVSYVDLRFKKIK